MHNIDSDSFYFNYIFTSATSIVVYCNLLPKNKIETRIFHNFCGANDKLYKTSIKILTDLLEIF